MTEFELLTRLGVALAIGLLVGLERGWRGREEEDFKRTAGIRTFALVGLLGGVSGIVAKATDPIVLGFIFFAFTAAFAAYSWMEARAEKNYSVTAVVAAMLTFVLGAYAIYGPLTVAVACAVAMTVLLALREPLHRWLKSIEWTEIRAVLILLAMSFLLLPVLPNRIVDPWGVINPAEIWLLAIMIAAISFVGYVAVKVLGERLGVAMAALAGGLASSTATTVTLARLARNHPGSARVLSGGILLASSVMLGRVLVVVGVLNRSLLFALLAPLAAAALVFVCCAAWMLRGKGERAQPKLTISNPLELGMAFKLAALIALILILAEFVTRTLGDAGILALAAASGLADVDALTISMARLSGGQVTPALAAQAILIAVAVNTATKTFLSGALGGASVATRVAFASIAAALAAYLALTVSWGLPGGDGA